MAFWEKWYYFTDHDGCSKVPSCAFSDQQAFPPSLFLFNPNKTQSLSSLSEKGNYTFFACAAQLQQEFKKLHEGIACGEAHCFQHFFVSRYNFYYSKFLGCFHPKILSLAFLLCSPVCHPRAMTVSCDKTSHGLGRAKPQRNDCCWRVQWREKK